MKNYRGFTLVEAILASVILCAAVLVIGSMSTRTLSDTKLNREYETACSLIDRQLTIIDYMGISEFKKLGRTKGTFENFEPRYLWEATVDETETLGLYDVKMSISWTERNIIHSVFAKTRYFTSSTQTETETESEND